MTASTQELFQVAAVSPMSDVPKCAIPDPISRLQPPVFHFGWVLDLETCRGIVVQRRLSRVHLDENSGQMDSSDELADKDAAYWMEYLGGEENMSEDMRACIQASLNTQMMNKLTSDLMKELGLWDLADDDFVQSVLALTPGKPNRFRRLALSVGDNFHLDELPSSKVLTKIKEAFRFDCEAGWFVDALDTQWAWY